MPPICGRNAAFLLAEAVWGLSCGDWPDRGAPVEKLYTMPQIYFREWSNYLEICNNLGWHDVCVIVPWPSEWWRGSCGKGLRL